MKICKTCNNLKDYKEYYRYKQSKDGFRYDCKSCFKLKKAEYQKQNNNKYTYVKKYIKNNKEKVKNYRKIYVKEHRKINTNFRLAHNLRSRLYHALKQNQKAGSAVKDLGCSIDELKIHLEKQFTEGMSWDNYGKWELDHIIPLSKVDLTIREEFLKVNNYKNLQPLWKIHNIKKSNKYCSILEVKK